MLDNLTLIAIVIIVLWLATFAFYMVTSRQQPHIEEELQSLKEMLGPEDSEGPE